MSQSDKKYMTQKELAARWGIDRTTLAKWSRQGKPMPKGTNLGQNSRVRYAIEDVEAFEAANKAEAPST